MGATEKATSSFIGRVYQRLDRSSQDLLGDYLMLHHPLYRRRSDDVPQAQRNLTDFCLENVAPLSDRSVVEVGCGNGMQALYIWERHRPAAIVGVDLDGSLIARAQQLSRALGADGASFVVGDAQNLSDLADDSFDVLINVQSAFHYPRIEQFLAEIRRVVKPGGSFVIADILSNGKPRNMLMRWLDRRTNHIYRDHGWYRDELARAGLQVDRDADVTHEVIRGFDHARRLLRRHRHADRGGHVVARLVALVLIVRSRYYMRRACQYYVFAGRV